MSDRVRIYQLFVRHFGNTNESRVPGGAIVQNGCGKFADITERALEEIKEMGFTHLWLTGVLEHASGTSYPNRPADNPVLLKGRAGSPYAVKDYFDVCPDYACDPENRLEEFKELLARCRSVGLKVVIDFVPNHVARSYGSDVEPDLSFGKGDDVRQFFHRENHFFYLEGEWKMQLPGGLYEPEVHGRVTGNNAATWSPSPNDWYETVKLNYGHDFRTGRDTSHMPEPEAELHEVPKTWRTMDAILSYWQLMGVDGFRCDMAHMVPMEFWRWAVRQARWRNPEVYFMAEAYDGDRAKLTDENVLHALLDSGFDSVYDGDSYELVKQIYEGDKWANDLDDILWDERKLNQMLRYAENHDEVRIASPKHWGGHGLKVGVPVTAFLLGVGRGPCMLYNGQEVGEPAIGSEGFSGDDGRSSIFDYWSLPEFCKWVHGGSYDGALLSEQQKELRDWYAGWIQLMGEPAFSRGEVFGLNYINRDNEHFGRAEGEHVSGKWMYAFLRRDRKSGQAFLVVIHFNPWQTAQEVEVRLSQEAREWIGHEVAHKVVIGEMAPCSVEVVEFWGDFEVEEI
ncbi:Glycosidase [Rubritalea squalenifaciens DSM 18772]|uniref:Glycosidase n=1 Tax=Rubritalea squalenifaciens DSM 18772 TaxID=1123071 RepID=A0A1M6LTG3_9BACT|nr:alpha-amylase family glycosyl hydrolase [Rubritalea squalenifaciens]SHJ74538.1 Glycosidase [Rubritalea squalenifaciens DSM 18772]